MNSPLEHLVSLLKVTPIERDVYLGHAQDLGFGQLFGGHVLAQSLMAAAQTIESGRLCHSLHGYFLRLGKTNEAIYYEVDAIRSGQSFSTRRVVAKQGGVAIFTMSASFQSREEGFSHQETMPPGITGPDGLMSELDRIRSSRDKIPEKARESLTADRAIEIRVVDPVDYFAPEKRPAIKNSWFRTTEKLTDTDPYLSQAILAYASDFGLASTAGMPHGFTFFKPGIQIASLDHSIWFHRPVNIDGWMLYAKDSPTAAGSRGFNRGQIFSAEGSLMASVAQESLIRTAKKGR